LQLTGNKKISGVVADEIEFSTPAGKNVQTIDHCLGVTYKVVDADISAGELLGNAVSRYYCEVRVKPEFAGGAEVDVNLWDIRTGEFAQHLRAIGQDDDETILDSLPTTNEYQNAGWYWRQNIDWSMFTKGSIFLQMLIATAEWGEASAFELEAVVDLLEGKAPYTEAFPREYKAASTDVQKIKYTNFIDMGGYGKLSAGYVSAAQLNLDEGNTAWKRQHPQSKQLTMIPAYLRLINQVDEDPSTDDQVDEFRVDPAVYKPSENRELWVTPSESATLTYYPRLLIGSGL
jgi:hypothetical protein